MLISYNDYKIFLKHVNTYAIYKCINIYGTISIYTCFTTADGKIGLSL